MPNEDFFEKHRRLFGHFPREWTNMPPEPELRGVADYAECEKMVSRILEGGNFAERVSALVEILRAFGVKIT